MIKAVQPDQGSPAGAARWKSVVWIAAIALIYFLMARVSLSFTFKPEGIAAIWPPSGIFLSGILLTRRNLRPWLVAALFFTDLAAEMLAGIPPLVSLVYSAALTGDAVLGAWLLRKFVGERPAFQQVRQVIGFLLLCVLVSNALAAVLAALAAVVFLKVPFWSSWLLWWSSDGVGNLLVTPLVMSLAYEIRNRFPEFKLRRFMEGAILFFLSAFFCDYIFSHFLGNPWFILLLNIFIFPFLIWAAIRFGLVGTGTISAVLAVIVLRYAIAGSFAQLGLNSNLEAVILVQVYIAMATIPAILLAAVMAERKQTEDNMRASEAKFSKLFHSSPDAILLTELNSGKIIEVNKNFEEFSGYSRDELIGHPVLDFNMYGPAERQRFVSMVKDHTSIRNAEFTLRKKTGEELFVLASAELIVIDNEQHALTILHDITERKRAEGLQEAVYRIAAAAETSPSLDELYPQIHEIVSSVMPAENFYIALYDKDQDLLRFPYIKDAEDEPFIGTIHPGKGVTAYVLRTGKSLLGTQAVHEELERRGEVILLGVPSAIWLGVPLIVEGETIGVMAVQHYSDPKAYGESEQHMLEFVSTQVAITILRKKAEEALQESEERYRGLVDQSLMGIGLSRLNQVIFANPALLHIFGYDNLEEFAKTPLLDHVAPASRDKIANLLKLVAQGNTQRADFEYDIVHKDGTTRTLYASATHIVIGGEIYTQTAFQDITERKQAERLLHESKEQLQMITDNMQDMVIRTDLEGLILYASPSHESVLGAKPEDLMGKSMYAFMYPDDIDRVREFALSSLQDKTPGKQEFRYQHMDGHYLWLESSGAIIFGENGLPVGAVFSSRDVTERKQAEEKVKAYSDHLEEMVTERTRELSEAQEKLIRQEKLAVLGQLAGSVGHELRNPLGVINTSIYYLKLVQPEADGKIKEHYAMIEQEVHNADKIISDLLDFGRVISSDRKSVSVHELVKDVLSRFPVLPPVQVTIKIPADLPKVYADPRQVEQVLGNLTTNACQAMVSRTGMLTPASTLELAERGKVTIAARLEKDMVAIAVKDSGTGISPENMKKLFEPLFTTKVKGIGLGLAVSKKLAEANGGRIEVESEVGRGSTFTLVLPVNRTEDGGPKTEGGR